MVEKRDATLFKRKIYVEKHGWKNINQILKHKPILYKIISINSDNVNIYFYI
jgi:hypothetical protein